MQRFLRILIFFLLLMQICFAQLELSSSQSRLKYSSTNYNSLTNIDSFITATMSTTNVPGLSACIVRDGEIIWKGAYGYADIANNIEVTDSTLFKIASLSKTITGAALMQLWEAGLFELDDNINDYLNDFQVHIPNYYSNPITFRMLLTHTSSIADNGGLLGSLVTWGGDSPITLDSLLKNYFTPGGIYYNSALNFVNAAPGTVWQYSNVGSALIGYLVETISGKSFEQYCQDSIFIPLGMDETSWFLSNLNTNHIALPYSYSGGSYHSYGHYGMVTYPAGQLRTSAVQFARHLISFMQKGQIDGIRILDSSSVELMRTIQFPNLNNEQGLIWFIYQYTVPSFGTYTFCGHNGSSYGVRTGMDFTLEPDANTGVIVLTNSESDAGRNIIRDALFAYSATIPTYVSRDLATSPDQYYLSQNYPNPFNPVTTIRFSIPKEVPVNLSIYNLLGERIKELKNEMMKPGYYEVEFSAKGGNASQLASGVYFYRINAGDYTAVKKMLLLK